MDSVHFFVLIPIICLIIFFQAKTLRSALRKIHQFKSIIPSNILSFSIFKTVLDVEEKEIVEDDESDGLWTDDESISDASRRMGIEVSQIRVKSDNPTMAKIEGALNMYLQKNKGAVSDFNLMKDVVERYCGAEEEEISVMQPIPLYMGLMGTMIGIIVGVFIISLGGGIQQVGLNGVSALMACVAVAMIASFAGICFTTIISWKAKGAKTQIEGNKNQFYSWLQTELLPTLSGNAATALSLLQNNLVSFNNTFGKNIGKFDDVLSEIRQVSKDQSSALKAISRLDLTRTASANVKVLHELQQCTDKLELFNQYLNSVNGYLNEVHSLNEGLNEHLGRTAAIEKMGTFFENEMNQIQSREDIIRTAVNSVDEYLKDSATHMKESMDSYISELKAKTTSEMEQIKNLSEESQRSFAERVKSQQDMISAKTNEMEKLLQGITSFSETKSAINSLVSFTKRNNELLNSLISAIESSSSSSRGGEYRPVKVKRGFAFYYDIFVKSVVLLTALAIITFIVIKVINEGWYV